MVKAGKASGKVLPFPTGVLRLPRIGGNLLHPGASFISPKVGGSWGWREEGKARRHRRLGSRRGRGQVAC